MIEPIDPPISVPTGGWSKALVRMDVLPCRLDEAIYWLADHARRHRVGVIAELNGFDLIAWPHQSVAEIERTYTRLKREAA